MNWQKVLDITVQTLPWLKTHGLQIGFIVIGAYIVSRFGKIITIKLIRKLITSNNSVTPDAEKKREDTLIRIFSTTLKVAIWIIATMMILEELGIAVAPLIAAAGIAGLALGFGGQYLIRDLITGLFIIMESQYRIGDVVCFDTTCGTVEDISMRMTTLRDMDGTAHHVPHGEIKRVSNMSKKFARVNVNIGVSYSANLEHVISVINRVGKEIAEDPEWKGKVITPPQFLRVHDLGDSAVVVKIMGDTAPLQQWAVMGEVRKRIKIAFDTEGIEIPFPQRVVHQV